MLQCHFNYSQSWPAQAKPQPYSSQQLQTPYETVMFSIGTEPIISHKPIRTIHICKRILVEATQTEAVGAQFDPGALQNPRLNRPLD